MEKAIYSVDDLIRDIFSKPSKPVRQEYRERLEDLLLDLKKETRSVYTTHINRFIDVIGEKGTYDRWDVRRFLRYMRDSGYSLPTIRVALAAVKTLFEAKGIDWDVRRRDIPEAEVNTDVPVMTEEDVKKLIYYVKKSGYDDEKVIIALATVYGLRRGEISGIRNEDVFKDRILIRTEKKGRKRYHLIPDEISFIKDFNYDNIPSKSTVNKIFNRLCSRAGINRRYRQGIHSIRHAVVFGLRQNGLSELKIYDFLRWENIKLGQLMRYGRSKSSNFDVADREVFEHHPFLKYWRKNKEV